MKLGTKYIVVLSQAFCVAGPVTWNSLPLHIRSIPITNFQKHAQDKSFLTFLLD